MSVVTKSVVSLGVVLSLALANGPASAQLLPRFRNPQPVVQPQVVPDQVAPQPGQTAPPAAPGAQPGQEQQPPDAGTQYRSAAPLGRQFSPIDPAKIVRGSQLIGQTIVDPNSQKVGVIKDFLIDSQSARVEYLLTAQEGVATDAGWTVIPFDLLQMSANQPNAQPVFVLNVPVAQFRSAPHMRSNAWDMLRDPRFIGQIQQFYRTTEWTALRHSHEMYDGQLQQRDGRQPGQHPQGQPGTHPGTPGEGQPKPGTQPLDSQGGAPQGSAPRSQTPPAEPRPSQPDQPQAPR